MYTKFYETKDLNMATVLFAVGCKIDSTEWKGTELYWIFEDEKKCLKIETKYMRKELKIEPQNLFQSNRYIRGLIYN